MQSPVAPANGVSGQIVSPDPASGAAGGTSGSTTVSRPVVQAVPDAAPTAANGPTAAPSAAPASPATAARTTTAQRTPRAAAPVAAPVAATAVEQPAAESTDPVAVAPIAPVTVQPMPLPAASEPAVQDAGDGTDTAVWVGALLSALALASLAGVAGVAIRRRRKVHDLRDLKIERPVIDNHGLPLGASVARPVATAVNPEPVPPLSAVQQSALASTAAFSPPRPVTYSRAGMPALPHTGASVALPRQRHATAAERRALIEQLAAARPDRANPFRSHKARLHRAKLIEQSIGRTFPGGRSRIDLSQYPMNWPELSSSRPAAA